MSFTTLFKNKPKRLFAFGCSFTQYNWTTWPEILAYELDIPFYNFGRSGAGNFYMFNQLMQSDSIYNFTPDDLIIVCWTNIYRDDRYRKGGWQLRGNIFNNPAYSIDYATECADIEGYALRDYSLIKAADHLLMSKQIPYHFISMCNITERTDQMSFVKTDSNLHRIATIFKLSLDKILPSFYDVLWQDDLSIKVDKDNQTVSPLFWDGHPNPQEHLDYLTATFGPIFSSRTINKVSQVQQYWISFWKEKVTSTTLKNVVGVARLSAADLEILKNKTLIKKEKPRSHLMI